MDTKPLRNIGRRSQSSGFSLIELLIVVAVLIILAAIAIPRFSAAKTAAGDATAKADLRSAKTAVARYYLANGAFPAALADLEADGYSLSSKVTLDISIRTEADGSQHVHMHIQHANSPTEWQDNYPEQ